MRKKVILITGANGEIGHALILHLAQQMPHVGILALDIRALDAELTPYVETAMVGDILDTVLLQRLMSEYEIQTIYHFAALLSTRAEITPEVAHRVNVEGTINLLHLAIEQSRWQGHSVKFIFPSSVAVFGMPNIETKTKVGAVHEDTYNFPITMYGCNKLYCENLGRYYADHYRQLAATSDDYGVDFRCLRFPGLISALTVPSGGTSDYAPEMLHAAAQNKPYQSFVRADTTIPFMAMPDAIKSINLLTDAPRENLTRHVYNVTSFSLSAQEIATIVQSAFPNAEINFSPDDKRQAIVDSWPAQMDDQAAQNDWGWQPDFDVDKAFHEYLIPTIRQRY